MKKYLLMTVSMFLFMSNPAFAAEDIQCKNGVNIKVNGMVCDFCARALEKVFGQRKDVESIKVDLDNSLVSIAMKPGQEIDDVTLKQLITDSGYDVRSIDRGC